MSDTPHGQLMDHEYDGIREYDNPTPGWWHMLFWGAIVFAIVYILYYHFSIFSPSIPARWEAAKTAHFERIFGTIGTLEGDRATILQYKDDEEWRSFAASIFSTNCATCHKADGTGDAGPNLTDDYYIHVQAPEDIFTTVSNGVVAKGMPSWANKLSQNERVLVAAYVASLRGSTTGGKAKEAESKLIDPWPEPPATD